MIKSVKMIHQTGRKLSDVRFKKKASTETELFYSRITPTEINSRQAGSEERSDEVSTSGAKKGQRSQIARDDEDCKTMDEEERQKLWLKPILTKKIRLDDPFIIKGNEEVSKETVAKRKKSIPRKSTRKRQKIEEDAEKEELKGFLDIILREETCVLTENFMYYQVFRGDGSSKNYKILSEMLEDFDRQDVEELYRLVKEKYSASRLEGYGFDLWRFYILYLSLIKKMRFGKIKIHMVTEKKYPLSQELLSKMLSKKLEVDHESSQALHIKEFIRSQEKELILLMVKATDLVIIMNGDILWDAGNRSYNGRVSTIVILDSSKVTNALLRKESIKTWDQQS
ncbi:hypothetical protein Tco_0217167 [Tanacetum coccineum]